MRELAILSFVTLDGVMQAPSQPDEDRSGGFSSGGWAAPYWEEAMAQVGRVAMAEPYDMLFGRRTYDLFAGHWPDAEPGPAAERLNAARKYVATSRPDGLTWGPVTALSGDVAAQIAALKRQDGPLLQVHGSTRLIQLLRAHDLIDEYRLWTFPVTVGTGKRLFDDGEETSRPLTLRLSETTTNGVQMTVYRRAR